jgi:putative endonuclease
MNKKQTGRIGENIACKFLLSNGFEILDRNYQKKIGEIDIIAFKKGTLHFFEVKTVSRETLNRYSNGYYRPEDNVTREKISKIERTANIFLCEKGFNDEFVQIDLLTVYLISDSEFKKITTEGECNYHIDYYPNINFR